MCRMLQKSDTDVAFSQHQPGVLAECAGLTLVADARYAGQHSGRLTQRLAYPFYMRDVAGSNPAPPSFDVLRFWPKSALSSGFSLIPAKTASPALL